MEVQLKCKSLRPASEKRVLSIGGLVMNFGYLLLLYIQLSWLYHSFVMNLCSLF